MRMTKFINRLDAHHKLGISLFFGALAIIMTGSVVEKPVNWMIGWLAYSASHLGLAWVTILSSHPAEVRREVNGQDSNRIMIYLFVIVASFVSLFAILFLLSDAEKTASEVGPDRSSDPFVFLHCVFLDSGPYHIHAPVCPSLLPADRRRPKRQESATAGAGIPQ
jgi:hypothetical protein